MWLALLVMIIHYIWWSTLLVSLSLTSYDFSTFRHNCKLIWTRRRPAWRSWQRRCMWWRDRLWTASRTRRNCGSRRPPFSRGMWSDWTPSTMTSKNGSNQGMCLTKTMTTIINQGGLNKRPLKFQTLIHFGLKITATVRKYILHGEKRSIFL